MSLIAQAQTIAEKYTRIANKCYNIDKPVPRIFALTRATTVAGKANGAAWLIRLNYRLFELHPEELDETIGHEIAHLYDHAVYRGRSHGPSWRQVMLDIGLNPSVCHSMKNAALVGKNTTIHVYECGGCGTTNTLGAKRHKKIQSGVQYWHCRGHSLNFVRTTTKHEHARANGASAPKPAKQTTPTSAKRPAKRSGTKTEQAMIIYLNNLNATRATIIQMFIDELDMTKSGASTYHYNCKKKAGK